MDSIEPEERKGEVDSVSSEKHSEIPPPQNIVTDSISLTVENPVSGSQQPTEPPSILDSCGSFLSCYMPIPNPLKFLIICLVFVCFAPVAYALITVATVTILPFLLAAFVFLPLFPFIVSYEYRHKQSLGKVLRYWISVVMMLLLVEVGLFYPLAHYVSRLKLVMIIGLPITKWINIIFKLIGIYLIDYVVWVFINAMMEKYYLVGRSLILEPTSEIVGCLLFLWAEFVVMSSIPTFKKSNIFGIYTDIWIKVSLFLLIGYNIITFLTNLFVWSLERIFGDSPGVGGSFSAALSVVCGDHIGKEVFNEKYVVYVANGIKRSVIFILSVVMFLLTWMVYFGKHLGTTPKNKRVLELGTWTMVRMLICSFLWLIKSCILLYWEAHVVYDRLHSKITDIGRQFYFLILILPDTDGKEKVGDSFLRKCYRKYLIDHTGPKASIYDIEEVAKIFLSTAKYLLSEETIASDLHHLQGNNSEDDNGKCIKVLKQVVQVDGEGYFDNDWEMLLQLLPDVNTTEEITFQKVETFVARARSSCMFLTNTFISENEVVKCLNQVMGGIIIVAIFIMWLLVTGLASTKVLVIIASPALAATFIFGDTAKSFFQGLIFVYVVHPFDVGDLCLIDEQLVEVNRISIWSTTFSNVRTLGEQQQVIYPNSVLAQKNVINYKSNFNWNDSIEFLCSPDKKITVALKHKIQTYIDHEKEKFTQNFRSVEILEMGDKAKIVVHIKHKLPGIKGWMNFECLKAKEERRFEFAVHVQNLVKELESGTETPESAEMNNV